jgi:hypothetical protein
MAEEKSKTEPTGQHSSDNELEKQVPAVPESEAPVFDDDSMFNSADRQAALLSHQQSGKKIRKQATEKTHKPEKWHKAG